MAWEGCRQLLEDFLFLDAQLVMAGVVVLGDDVRVLELVAALAAGVFEADGEGQQVVVDTRLAQQTHQQAGVDSAGQQHADVHRSTLTDRHRFAHGVQGQTLPVFEAVVALVFAGTELQLPPALGGGRAIGVDTHPAGRGSFSMPAIRVSGAGTTAWKLM